MKNRFLIKILPYVVCAVLSALFIVVLFYCAPQIQSLPETTGSVEYTLKKYNEDGDRVFENVTAVIGEDLTAVRISDFGRLNKITKVNYVADKYVSTSTLGDDMQIVDLTRPFEFAEKGTLIFVILSLDPYAEDFDEQSERLSEYLIGENWCFSLYLPKIFCASNVYRKTALIDRHGNIEDYKFIDYTTSYDRETQKFSAETEGTTLTLSFYTRRVTMDDALNAAQIITVHYQSTGSSYSGIKDAPLIGAENAVKTVREQSQRLLSAFAVLAAVVLSVFVALSFLKHTVEFMPCIVWVFGIALMMFSGYMLTQATRAPLLWTAFRLAAPYFIICGALLAVCKNIRKIPTKTAIPSVALFGALFALIIPFIPFGAATALKTVCTAVRAICTAALFAFTAISISCKNKRDDWLKTVGAVIIAVGACASLFMPQIYPLHINPLFWLCSIITVITFIGVFMLFRETEKSNEHLTANLHKEVERQVKDIKSVIEERDNLLRFVSHDMKKPLVSSSSLIDTLIEREKDAEQTKALRIVKQNTVRVVDNLSEIADYAKFNYLAEPSQVADLSELCALLYKYHELDCSANGIILKNTVDRGIKAFVKKQALENVVSNLIINAVEHADCSAITISAKIEKHKTVLCVSDDGKGIDKDKDVFRPYVSENNNAETGGVGLYICKSIIESMNGTLDYSCDGGGTVFRITLLRA